MSGLDRLLPADGASIVTLAERYMTEEVAPRALAREAQSDPPTDDVLALDELGLTDILSTSELGTADQRLALLLALGQTLGRTDAGLAMAVLTSALTEQAIGVRAGFGVQITRPTGQAAVLLTAGRKTQVLVDPSGQASQVSQDKRGSPLLGLRLGGGQLLEAPPAADPTLTAEDLAALQGDLALAAISVALGTAAGSLRTAMAYAEERYQGGTMIVHHHPVDQMLRAMADHIAHGETLRMALLSGPTTPSRRALFTLAFDACEAAVSNGVQVLGGYGYMQEYGQEKRMRDTKTLRLLFGPPAFVGG
jgi:alkylation response protein AidB-like acyl-CoA dehydrogenase